MLKVTKEFHFEAAHMLPHHDGQCSRLHGHTYRMIVSISASEPFDTSNPSSEGMLIDFGDLKTIVNQSIIEKWDHRFLGKGDEWPALHSPAGQTHLVGIRTTVENLSTLACRLIGDGLAFAFPTYKGRVLVQVRLYEGLNNSALSEIEVKWPQLSQ